MELLNIIFALFSFLLAFLAAGILFWVNKEQRHSNKLLALVLFILAFQNLNNALLYSTWMLKVPWMFRIVTPVSLLITPAAYIYTRSILLGELKFRKNDWLLLIPAILYAINLLPVYLMPIEEKKAYLSSLFENRPMQAHMSDGILPPYVFSFIRIAWSSVFVFLGFRLISRFIKKSFKQVVADNAALLRWLKILNGLLAVILTAYFVVAVFAPIIKINFSLLDIILGIIVLIICVQLFLRPKLLYGIYQPVSSPVFATIVGQAESIQSGTTPPEILPAENAVNSSTNEQSFHGLTISYSESYRYKKKLETFFQSEKPFLKVHYTLEQLVIDAHIHRHTLSAFINREYGMGFREFLNRYRINYFKENLDNPVWKNLTLEAIAEHCGFSNRSTFIKNFKEITGLTPSEYIKKTKVEDRSRIL